MEGDERNKLPYVQLRKDLRTTIMNKEDFANSSENGVHTKKLTDERSYRIEPEDPSKNIHPKGKFYFL